MGKWTKYVRRYCVEWETDPRLKDWLRPLPGESTKAYCRFCRAVLRAHHSDLLVHTGTRKHIRNTALFLTSCNLKNVSGDSKSDNPVDGVDTHLCGKCGARFRSLSSFIYHKVEEEGYRLMYSPSERNRSLILPNLLENSNETILSNSTFPTTQSVGQTKPEVTSVSITVASLPETFSDDERCSDTDEETNWEDHTADRETNDSQETNEAGNYSDESDKVNEYFACCFCDKLFASLKHTQVHLAKVHQAVIDGDGDLNNDGKDADADDLKEIETDAEDCEEDFECNSCGAKFKKLSVLKAHQLTHTDIRIHACTYPNCKYSFKTKGSLERHMRRHTGERPFVCNLCGRKFSESGVLARHLKSQIPCTMKSDAEFPRYGKPLKLLTENEVQTDVNQLDLESSGNGLICDNTVEIISNNPVELLEQNLPGEERNFTTMKENLDISDGNLTSNNESPILVLPPCPSTNQQLENKCSACHKSFESLDELKNHLILHLSSESFHCNVCDYLAKDEIDLIEHHNKQHSHYNIDNQDDAQLPPEENIIIEKEILENGSANTLGLSKVVEKQLAEIENISLKDNANSASEAFTCNICRKIFKSGVYFRLHMKMHENSKRFRCSACDKSFQLKDGLRKHMTCHSKSKFMCAVCGKMYKTISHVKEHMRAHTSERPFVCHRCDKGFKSRNGLKVHLRTHTDDYPYSCSYCECKFREKPALVRHTRTHTGEKPFSCKHCGRSFAEHGTLNRHLRAKVPCTAQRKVKKSESDVATSIQSVYENNQPAAVDLIQEVDMVTTDSFQNLTSAEGQQYIIASGDDKEILSESPQIDITGTIPMSDFESLNAGSYIIISQSDGTSEAVVAEFPIENVTFVPEPEGGESIALNKEM